MYHIKTDFFKYHSIKEFIYRKQHILYPMVSKLTFPDFFDYEEESGSTEKDRYLQQICENYFYSDFFNEDQIAQFLPLACAAGHLELIQV